MTPQPQQRRKQLTQKRGPTAGAAASGLSGTAGRLAALIRGRHSVRQDRPLEPALRGLRERG